MVTPHNYPKERCLKHPNLFFERTPLQSFIVATPQHLLKKRGFLKSTQISFLRAHRFSLSLTMATPLGMSRAKFHVRLKVTNYLPLLFFFFWYDVVVCLVVYVLRCLNDIFCVVCVAMLIVKSFA